MLRVWRSPVSRPTMDTDMLGRTSNRGEDIIAQFGDALQMDVEPDGLIFDAGTIQTEQITEDADYVGLRVRFLGLLDTARIHMQVDIGFGDIVQPDPEVSELPTILDMPAPRLLCYSRESAIAEKFEAMVKLREINGRMKDFYDLWLLSRQFDFDGAVLAEATRHTFGRRGTEMPADIVAFPEAFAVDKQVQWTAFRRRLRMESIPAVFDEAATAVREFLGPVAQALRSRDASFLSEWAAPGPWTPSHDVQDPVAEDG